MFRQKNQYLIKSAPVSDRVALENLKEEESV